MHNPPQYTPKICTPGCVCKTGYVWDSVEKNCVKGNECPCHHGGVSYSDGDMIQEDCNTWYCILNFFFLLLLKLLLRNTVFF